MPPPRPNKSSSSPNPTSRLPALQALASDYGEHQSSLIRRRVPPAPSQKRMTTASNSGPSYQPPHPHQQAATPGTNTKCIEAAHQVMLAGAEVASLSDTALTALLAIFTLLDPKTGTSPCSRLKRVASLTLAELPPLEVYVKTPVPYIMVL